MPEIENENENENENQYCNAQSLTDPKAERTWGIWGKQGQDAESERLRLRGNTYSPYRFHGVAGEAWEGTRLAFYIERYRRRVHGGPWHRS